MAERVCVFIDGENFRHSICGLFEGEFNQADYLPKLAKWADLYDHIVKQSASGSGGRLRAYWYVVEHLDFYPSWFPSPDTDYGPLLGVLCKDWNIRAQLDRLGEPAKKIRATAIMGDLVREKQKMRARFDGWTVVQNAIAQFQKAIEFRRAGAIRYDLFRRRFGTEKAVDVNLATDAVILKDNYDMAVIVSGDQDYVPAVQHLKDSGKHVVNVAFRTRSGVLLPGGAKRLNHVTDWSLELSYDELKTYLGIGATAAIAGTVGPSAPAIVRPPISP